MTFKKFFVKVDNKNPYPYTVSLTDITGDVYFTDESGIEFIKKQDRPITFAMLPKPLLKQIK